MRIWSIHPKYLDAKGLVTLWRETLLAKNVLEGKTKGYKNHPQLNRFKNSESALGCINQYLTGIYNEALSRGYNFNKNKINVEYKVNELNVTNGQIKFEMKHLLKKLKTRDTERFIKLSHAINIDAHPIFKIIDGNVEEWEKTN